MPGTDRSARRGQRHVDAFGDQRRGVPFGAEHLDPGVEGALRGGPGLVDPAAGVRALGLGQCPKRLACQCDRRLVAEMLGLRARQGVQIARLVEGLAGGVHGGGQCLLRQFRRARLIYHPAIIATEEV